MLDQHSSQTKATETSGARGGFRNSVSRLTEHASFTSKSHNEITEASEDLRKSEKKSTREEVLDINKSNLMQEQSQSPPHSLLGQNHSSII